MRFIITNSNSPPENYEWPQQTWIRKEKFLFLPRKIKEEVRWLEHGHWYELTSWSEDQKEKFIKQSKWEEDMAADVLSEFGEPNVN